MRRPLRVGRLVLACALSWTGVATAALPATPESVAKETLLDTLAPILAARGATATITADADSRRALAPCNQMTGFLPPGARLSGRTLVGVRCTDGASWQTFVAAEVRVEGTVWQATRALRAGDPLGAGDVVATRAVLTAPDLDASGRSTPATRTLASLDGRTPAPVGRIVQRPVAMGRPLTASDVRDEGRIGAGDPVRVIYRGDGFAVTSEGHATGAADPGSSVSIRLASGAVVAGTLRADHLVELPR